MRANYSTLILHDSENFRRYFSYAPYPQSLASDCHLHFDKKKLLLPAIRCSHRYSFIVHYKSRHQLRITQRFSVKSYHADSDNPWCWENRNVEHITVRN